jgi:hypothetical protein
MTENTLLDCGGFDIEAAKKDFGLQPQNPGPGSFYMETWKFTITYPDEGVPAYRVEATAGNQYRILFSYNTCTRLWTIEVLGHKWQVPLKQVAQVHKDLRDMLLLSKAYSISIAIAWLEEGFPWLKK